MVAVAVAVCLSAMFGILWVSFRRVLGGCVGVVLSGVQSCGEVHNAVCRE